MTPSCVVAEQVAGVRCFWRLAGALAVLATIGCGQSELTQGDAGGANAGTADGGDGDAGTIDAGDEDAGNPDAGTDAGTECRVAELDAGSHGACDNACDRGTLESLAIGDATGPGALRAAGQTCVADVTDGKLVPGVCFAAVVAAFGPTASEEDINAAITCVGGCIGGATSLSDECAACYGESTTCGSRECPWQCACYGTPGGCSAEGIARCNACSNEKCGEAFRACAGIDGPAPDDPAPAPCALSEGAYLFSSTAGSLSFACGPNEALTSMRALLDVSGPSIDCIHSVVVPSWGFDSDAICVEGGTLTTRIQQTACGLGEIDSNGGSDYTLIEVGDTSSSGVCSFPHPECAPGANRSLVSHHTVGDGTPDTCSGDGVRANVVFSLPAENVTWVSGSGECPDCDGIYHSYPHCGCGTHRRGAECTNPGGTDPECGGDGECVAPDVIVSRFPMVVDLSTDSATASFEDTYPDGCSFAGEGCAGPETAGGAVNPCFSPSDGSITLHGAGPVGSEDADWPSYDALWTTTVTGTLERIGDEGDGYCPAAPIVFGGHTQRRCYF